MRRIGLFSTLAFAAFAVCLYGQTRRLQLGRTPTPAEVRRWNITVLPDGTGLPAGSGTVAEGKLVYADKCSGCHGDSGEGREPLGSSLAGGQGTLQSSNPVLTVGSYWPYATTVWDYIHRAMPYATPGTLSANETYALTAFLLYRNGIIRKDDVMNQQTVPKVRMPNRNGFVPDPRPDVPVANQKPK
ncbi:MAG TPA: cytochrome c [Candidatus Acidoferrum sp.]|nr:cytochrome c [Candidatus Acidoferrum sp.]